MPVSGAIQQSPRCERSSVGRTENQSVGLKIKVKTPALSSGLAGAAGLAPGLLLSVVESSKPLKKPDTRFRGYDDQSFQRNS